MIIVYLSGLLIVLGIFYIVLHFISPANRLRKKISQLNLILDHEAIEILKKEFMVIYNLYLKLSEKKKRNFYPRVLSLREEIEALAGTKKRFEKLLKRVEQGSFRERKMKFHRLHDAYQKLSNKLREEYYTEIVRLRERLEQGR